ncbi:cytochrome c oxidase assembly factor 3, mitochondrial isoform X2 [Nomia melanderi]|nr:cytochrome c oxidase assembly factor 3, mitochondrial isoform X3 [Nomia melanderi]XP_031841965.1 cytochrome c oxidase assembly factor 3, mitochondrial isoform X3 [Nomia melanderi]
MSPVKKEQLKPVDYLHLKQAEAINVNRLIKHKALRKRVNTAGVCLGLFSFSIYLYTIYAVKQETFLDDFNEPETILIDAPNAQK